jgi:hypothetical protein
MSMRSLLTIRTNFPVREETVDASSSTGLGAGEGLNVGRLLNFVLPQC